MTINSDLSRARYVGNGVTATFVIPFAYLTNSDGTAQVAVYVGDSDIPLTEGKDYTVKGFGKYSDASTQIDEDLITYETRYENGEFTLVNIPLLGQAVAVIRDVPQTQGIVFVEGEKFPAQDFENGLDKLTMEVQEVKENLTRAIVLPPTSTDNPLEIRSDILKVADEAKKTAETAIGLVGNAPETIRKETENAKNIITEFTDVKTSQFNTLAENTQNEFVSYVDAKTQEFEQAAITATEQAVGSAERSRIWAEGEQAEVQELGGELSSMGAADLAYAIANAPEDTPIDASGLFAMNVVKGPKGDKGDKGDDGKDGGGLEIGDVAFAVMGIDESKNLRRYLNGQVISQSQFVSFANWVKERAKLYPNTVATEENWQAEVTNSPYGICGKFVIDDTLGTIRLPKYPDWSIREVGEAPVVGNGGALGVIKGTTQNTNQLLTVNLSGGDMATGVTYGNATTPVGVTTDTTKSGIIADLVNANTEDKLQGKWFIQVATGVEESVDVTREIALNNPFSLLDYKWSEYDISNASWLLSNGAFHSGTVYKSVYELLLKIHNGTETKDGVSVKLSTEDYEDTDFVINTADTTFRLPIKVKLASGNAVVGNKLGIGITDGSSDCNITSLVDWNGSDGGGNALKPANKSYGKEVGSGASYDGYSRWGNAKIIGITIDPDKSGIETSSYGLKLYFYVGETIQDANVIVASNVLTNAVMKNNSADREIVVSWGIPDYSAEVTISNNYTAPSNGFIFCGVSGNGSQNTTINGHWVAITYNTGVSGSYPQLCLPVSKGDVFQTTSGLNWARFYPLKGIN